MDLCVLCGSENKQRLFPYTALTDWFLKPRRSVYCAVRAECLIVINGKFSLEMVPQKYIHIHFGVGKDKFQLPAPAVHKLEQEASDNIKTERNIWHSIAT